MKKFRTAPFFTRKALSSNYSTFMLFCQITLMFAVIMAPFFVTKPAVAKDVQNFYFEDFTADYYLKEDEDGVSKLKVVENFTAVFPTYNQNKGLCRRIPYTTNNGRNITIKSMTKNDIVVKRNGLSEPIYSIEKDGGMYEICTGTEEYVLGKQVYTFEYEYQNVVTLFTKNGSKTINKGAGFEYNSGSYEASKNGSWEELYWDTNGTGFKQEFKSLTARLHFDKPENWTGEAWCYVGKHGSNNQTRCKITKIDDGVMFETSDLQANENLTFDVELKQDAYVLPPPEESHIMIYLTAVIGVIMALITFFSGKAYKKASEKRKYYKGIFVKPEYEPLADYDMHTLAEDFIGTRSNPSIATIVKMVIDKRISLIKGDKKLLGGYNWEIQVNNLAGINRNEEIILKILNGGNSVNEGSKFKLKRHYGNSKLESLGRELDKYGRMHGYTKGLLEDNKLHSSSAAIIMVIVWFAIMVIPLAFSILVKDPEFRSTVATIVEEGGDIRNLSEYYSDSKLVVGYKECVIAIVAIVILSIIVNSYLRSNSGKFNKRTKKGLEVSRYLEGLKLYIKMAETERIKFLQSVPNADVSAEGIVKLYEKLLPYAIFFGLEKTWLKEMDEFCQLNHINSETMNLSVSDVALMSSFIRTIPTSTNFSGSGSSSSGSSSSHSGGGGGGFSGGGGGGGGGGGR